MTSLTPNIIFEAADYSNDVELILKEKEGEFALHIVKDTGLNKEGTEFTFNSIVMKLEISDFVRLIDSIYPYLKRDGIEI